MEKVFIYTLATQEEPNNIRYIGKTKDIKNRFQRHISPYHLNEKTYKSRWLKQVIKEGKTPVIEVLDIVLEKEWEFWEQYWIEQFKAWNFYLTNTTLGGDGLKLTKEIILKRSQKLVGKKRSPETIKKIEHTRRKNAEKIGYWISQDTKDKIRKTLIGYKHSQETKKKLSEQRLGELNNFYGKKHSQDTITHLKTISKRKLVLQLTMNDKLIQEFNSIRDAAKTTGIDRNHISSCCNNKPHYLTAGGYKWCFKLM